MKSTYQRKGIEDKGKFASGWVGKPGDEDDLPFPFRKDDNDESEGEDSEDRPWSPSSHKDDVSLALDIIESYTVPIPPKLTSPPPKKALDLGPRRNRNITIGVSLMITSAQGALIGMDSGYVGMWYLPGSRHINPYLLMGYHRGAVQCAADLSFLHFGSKGRSLVATGGADATIRIWTYKNESARNISDADYLIQTIAGHRGTVTGLTCVGDVLVSCSKDGTVRTWRPKEGREVAFYPWFEAHQVVVESPDHWFMHLCFDRSPYVADTQQIILGSGQGTIHALEVEFSKDHRRVEEVRSPTTSRALANLRVSDLAVSAIRHIPIRNMIAVATFDNLLRIYDDRTGAQLQSCENTEGAVPYTSICVDEKHDQILLLDRTGLLTLYDLDRSRIVATKQVVEKGEGVAIAWRRPPRKFIPADPSIAAELGFLGQDEDGALDPFESPSGRDPFARSALTLGEDSFPSPSGSRSPGAGARLRALQKKGKNDKFSAFAVEDDLVAQESRADVFLSRIRRRSQVGRPQKDVDEGPTKDELLVTTTAGVTAWLVVRGLDYSIAPGGHEAPISTVACSSDALQPLQISEMQVSERVTFNNSDELERIFSCSLDGTLKVWDAYDLCILRTLNLATRGEISCLCYLPVTMLLAVGHENGGLSLIHPESGTSHFIPSGTGHRPNTLIHALCYLPQRGLDRLGPGYVASAGSDGVVGLWELAPPAPYHPHFVGLFDGKTEAEASCLAHDAMLNLLFSGYTDGAIQMHLAATREFLGPLSAPGKASVRSLLVHCGRVFVGREDGTLELIDLYSKQEKELRASFSHHRNLSVDIVAALRSEAQLKGPDSFQIQAFEAHSGPVTDIKLIARKGKPLAIATSSLDGKFVLRNCETAEVIKEWVQPEELRSICVRAKVGEVVAGTASGRLVKFSYRGIV